MKLALLYTQFSYLLYATSLHLISSRESSIRPASLAGFFLGNVLFVLAGVNDDFRLFRLILLMPPNAVYLMMSVTGIPAPYKQEVRRLQQGQQQRTQTVSDHLALPAVGGSARLAGA